MTTHHTGESDEVPTRYHVAISPVGFSFYFGGPPKIPREWILAQSGIDLDPAVWHLFTLTALDGRFVVELDGDTVLDHFDETLRSGRTHFQQVGNLFQVDDMQIVRLP